MGFAFPYDTHRCQSLCMLLYNTQPCVWGWAMVPFQSRAAGSKNAQLYRTIDPKSPMQVCIRNRQRNALRVSNRTQQHPDGQVAAREACVPDTYSLQLRGVCGERRWRELLPSDCRDCTAAACPHPSLATCSRTRRCPSAVRPDPQHAPRSLFGGACTNPWTSRRWRRTRTSRRR